MKLEYVFFCMIMINQNIDFGSYPSYGPVLRKKRKERTIISMLSLLRVSNSKVRNPVEKS